MKITFSILLVTLLSIAFAVEIENNGRSIHLSPDSGAFQAGAAKIDGTLPTGVPLAGFNWGPRRVPHWPLPEIRNYTTFMMPSKGATNPTWCKSLVLDDGTTRVAFVTIDAIGADGAVCLLAWELAVNMGLKGVPYENFVCSGSHTHSGPGAVSPELLWALAPATDFLVPEVQHMICTSMARAVVEAQSGLQPATLGMGFGQLEGVTRNRRAHISPYVTSTTIDPHLGVIRVDDMSGKPIGTLWNFAIHGTCLGPDNMYFNSDIMGATSDKIESIVGGVALFANSDAGDVAPSGEACDNNFQGAATIAQAVADTRASLKTSTDVNLKIGATIIDFGPTNLNFTLARFLNCTHGGPLDICTLCEKLQCNFNAHLPDNWVESHPKFTGIKVTVGGESHMMVTIPGEALVELGWWIRNGTQALGYDSTFLLGYSNNHMGYFTTPDEYEIGGYESQLTFWGIDTADRKSVV